MGHWNISNVFKDCYPAHSDKRCKLIFHIMVSVQLLTVIVGSAMNIIIFISFIRRKLIKEKISNILLFNQVLADLFNIAVYGLPYVMGSVCALEMTPFCLSVYYYSDYSYLSHAFVNASFISTLFSSILLFFTIALERFLSICAPLIHRAYVHKKDMWIAVAVVWCVSIALALLMAASNYIFSRKWILDIGYTVYNLLTILVLLVILLFVVTFVKALHSIKSPPTTSNTGKNNLKKQLRLTVMFFAMFMAFSLTFVPFIASIYMVYDKTSTYSYIGADIRNTCVMLTSVFNSTLILYLKKELRPCAPPTRRHEFHENIEMRPVPRQ